MKHDDIKQRLTNLTVMKNESEMIEEAAKLELETRTLPKKKKRELGILSSVEDEAIERKKSRLFRKVQRQMRRLA